MEKYGNTHLRNASNVLRLCIICDIIFTINGEVMRYGKERKYVYTY